MSSGEKFGKCPTFSSSEKEVINTGFAIPAKYGRMGKAKIFDFRQNRHGTNYEQKRVEVYFATTGDAAVTVTVYVFYGKWEG